MPSNASHHAHASPGAPETETELARASVAPELIAIGEKWGIRRFLTFDARQMYRKDAALVSKEAISIAVAALEQHPDILRGHSSPAHLRKLASYADACEASFLAAKGLAQGFEDETVRARAELADGIVAVVHDVHKQHRKNLDDGKLAETDAALKEATKKKKTKMTEERKALIAAKRATVAATRLERTRQHEIAAFARAEKVKKQLERLQAKAGAAGLPTHPAPVSPASGTTGSVGAPVSGTAPVPAAPAGGHA